MKGPAGRLPGGAIASPPARLMSNFRISYGTGAGRNATGFGHLGISARLVPLTWTG